MEYARLGSTGMKVSRICLGCMGFGDATRWIHKWVLNEEESRPIIQRALELGINFLDTANVYSIGASEEILGRALKDFARRDEVIIATKVHGRMHEGSNGAGLSRKAILEEERVGGAQHGYDDASLREGLDGLLELVQQPDIQARCAAAAKRHFSLDEGIARYRAVYRMLDPD